MAIASIQKTSIACCLKWVLLVAVVAVLSSVPVTGFAVEARACISWSDDSHTTCTGYSASSSDAATIGDIVCNLGGTSAAFPIILAVVAYVSGLFFIIKGMLTLKKHFDNTNESKMVPGIAHLLVGALLSTLPAFTGLIQNTLFPGMNDFGNGGLGCSNVFAPTTLPTVDTAASSPDMSVIFQNFFNNLYAPMFTSLSILSYVIGLYLIAKGLMKGSKVGTDPKVGSTHIISVNFVIGAILVSLPSMLDSVLSSLGIGDMNTSSNLYGIINWSTVTTGIDSKTDIADKTVQSCLMFVQVIGLIAFLRGWLMVKNALEGTGQQQTVPQGMTHIIGGAMAINIGTMLHIINETLGTGLING